MMSFLVVLLLVSCKNDSKTEIAASDVENVVKSSEMEDENLASTDLEVYDYEGLKSFLTTDSDTTYVVNFWATWCAPCIKELPYFEQMNSNYSNKKVEVILVSLDFPKKYDTNLKPYIKKNQLKSKVIALNDPDANSWIPKISEEWSGSIPATLIFNKDKRQFYEQSFTYDELETEVKQFLK